MLTVAICTYKRIGLLRETLESLARCEPIDQPWELLVVDNEGNDKVEALAGEFADRLPVTYSHEPSLGASHARNHAVRRARGEIILFTDDDVTFDPKWLVKMTNAIDAQLHCAFWGGRVTPVWPKDQDSFGCSGPPNWFDIERCEMLGDVIVRYERGETPRPWRMDEDPPFYTANLALRVEAIERAGYFDTAVGHRGSANVGMEDSLMVRAIAGAGGQGWYAADAVVYHPVPAARQTRAFARAFARKQGRLSVYLLLRETGASRPPRWFYRVAAEQTLRGLMRWCAGVIRFDPAQRFAGQFMMIFNLSKLYHAVFGKGGLP